MTMVTDAALRQARRMVRSCVALLAIATTLVCSNALADDEALVCPPGEAPVRRSVGRRVISPTETEETFVTECERAAKSRTGPVVPPTPVAPATPSSASLTRVTVRSPEPVVLEVVDRKANQWRR